jgi:hypothetical protein
MNATLIQTWEAVVDYIGYINNEVQVCHLTSSCNNTYTNNTAAQYGNDYATEESFLEFSPNGNYSLNWNESSVVNISSTKTSVQLFIVDYYSQRVVTSSDISVGWNMIDSGTTCSDSIDICGTNLNIAENGIVTFNDFSLSCSVGEQINLQFSTTSSLVSNKIDVIFEFDICVRGQIYYKDNDVCVTCTEGTYSLEEISSTNLDTVTTCKTCPSNAECYEDVVKADPGYWKVANDDAVMKCPYGEAACKGGQSGGDDTCNDGK